MKSLWISLVKSVIVVGVSTCSSTTLVADDASPAGVVRISQPKSANVDKGEVTQTSAQLSTGSCAAACAPSTSSDVCATGACDGYCDAGSGGWGRRGWRNGGGWGMSDGSGMGMGSGMGSGMGMGSGLGLGGRGQYGGYDHSMGGGFGHGGLGHRGFGHSSCLGDGDCDPNGHAMIDYLKCKFGYFIPSGGGGKGIPWVGHYARVYPVNPYYSDPRDGQAYAAQGYGIPVSVPLAPVVGHTYDYGWGVPSSRLTPVSHPAY
jgi:hypothetical protein